MKKSLICVAAVASMMCASVTSYAAGSYTPGKNYATFNDAAGKTVVIYKGTGTPTADNIVYVNQALSTFDASTKFLLKDAPEEGVYTVKFGGSDESASESTFYIGMIDAINDIELNMIDGENGYKAVVDNDVTTYNIGYTATNVDLSKGYQSIIIKNGENYMGCEIPSKLSGGGTVNIGIQINGVSGTLNGTKLTPEIDGVWLSTRGIETAADAQ